MPRPEFGDREQRLAVSFEVVDQVLEPATVRVVGEAGLVRPAPVEELVADLDDKRLDGDNRRWGIFLLRRLGEDLVGEALRLLEVGGEPDLPLPDLEITGIAGRSPERGEVPAASSGHDAPRNSVRRP